MANCNSCAKLNIIQNVRCKTLAEFNQISDNWLTKSAYEMERNEKTMDYYWQT